MRLLWCLPACAALVAVQARAQAESADEVRADALFRDGMQRFDEGNTAAACDAFTESLRLDPKLGTLLNLALCHERQGKTATAWMEFAHGAAWATQAGQRERREFANQHTITLEGQLSRVLLKLPPARELSSVELDGEPLPEPRWYLPMYLDPGDHTIAVSAPGKHRKAIHITIPREPSAQVVALPLLQDVDVPLPPKPPEPDRGKGQRAAGWVTGGVGVAGLAAGSVFGVLTLLKRDDIGSHCAGNQCDAQGAATRSDAQTLATVSTIAFAAGAAALVAGGVLLWTAPKAPRPSAGVKAWLEPRGAGIGGIF